METIIGRQVEIKIHSDALNSGDAELISVDGRRRIGKTFLIHNYYHKNIVFEVFPGFIRNHLPGDMIQRKAKKAHK